MSGNERECRYKLDTCQLFRKFAVQCDRRRKLPKTSAGRAEWMSLINGAKLQDNCNKEGFNIKSYIINLRIGIASNNENNCHSCDTAIGFGIGIGIGIKVSNNRLWKFSSGNFYFFRQSLEKTFGYIFVQ